MRGLTQEERRVLVEIARDPDRWLAEDDDDGEEIRDRLAVQRRVIRSEEPGGDDWYTIRWSISPLGRLALRACLPQTER